MISMNLPARFLGTLLLVVLLAGCGRPAKVASSPLSAAEEQQLKTQLARLDAALQQHAPGLAAQLAPPAAAAEIALLRAALGGAEIQPLELWFQWHDGSTKDATLILPLGFFLSARSALADRKAIQDIPFVQERRKSSIKLLEDGSGDGFFLDLSGSKPRVFYHMLEDGSTYQDFGRLDEFVGFIAQVHEAALGSAGQSGGVDYDLKKYGALEAAYLQAKSRP
jgi:hypothetical protein